MIEVELGCSFTDLAEQCEQHIGPRKFYLHNRIGGEGWDVRPMQTRDRGQWVQGCKARFDDPKMVTFLMLKLK
jgi:hypothetical protein